MLGIGGKFAGAKGMVQMPDLANLNPEQANTILTANGLRTKNQNSNNTTNSALNNKVFGQSVAAGDLVDYETEIDFSYYVYAAPAVTITYGSPEEYDTTQETGCNKTPNNQGSSNQYYYCIRTTRYYRAKKYENGIWNGEYGQYSSAVDTNWDCSIVAGQCGNTQVSTTEISRSGCIGSPGSTGYQNVTYRRNYAAGQPTNITYTVQETGCYIPPAVTEVRRSVTRGACGSAGGGGCKCGQRTVTTTIYYSDGTTSSSQSTECCPDSTSCSNTATYWFSCGAYAANKKRWTYRTVCTDCVGNVVSDTRYSGDVNCCSTAGQCGSEYRVQVGTYTYFVYKDCTVETSSGGCATETRFVREECTYSEDIWRDASGCLGTYKIQQQKYRNPDCSFSYRTRQVPC